MFTPSTNLLEIVVRVLLVYVGLYVLVRISGKREIGQLGPMDLLAMLLLSETVSPALTAQDTSILAAWTAAAALLGATFAVEWLTHRSRRAERWIEGRPHVLIEDGEVHHALQRRLRISDQELASALREQGVDTVADVKTATLEPNGRITVVRRPR
jgi:uncharacterized membrane protein YcaP (DUF421 family)